MAISKAKIKTTCFITIVLITFCILFTGCKNRLSTDVETVSTDNYMNKELEFYYYIPPRVQEDKQRQHPVLICIPGLNGDGTEFSHSPFREFAEKEGFILISPSFRFDKDNWGKNTSYQYPAAWSGVALLKMVKKVEDKFNLHIGKFYLYGFSAGAQFALRFPIWKPELCAATVGHASGGPIQIYQSIPVSYYISVGRQDTERIGIAEANYNRLRKLDMDARYMEYEGGHTVTDSQIQDSLHFIKEVRDQLGE